MVQNVLPWLGLISMVLCLILVLFCLMLKSQLNKLQKKYNFFMNGADGTSIERKLFVEVAELRDASQAMEQLFKQQAMIKKIQTSTFQKVGFVKYNAFENIGNDLSFSLTILDGNNNGVCISSLYGRNESRTFSKPIIEGKSLITLSKEELESLNEALGNKSNKEALVTASVSR